MKIEIYSTTTCPYCRMLKNWLNTKSIEFTEYMVDKNPIAAQNMVNLINQRGVPFSTVEFEDGRVEMILGFDRLRFEQVLAEK